MLMIHPDAPLLRPAGLRDRLLGRRHGGLVLFGAVFLGISFLTRVALLLKAAHEVMWSFSLFAAFVWGLVFDLGVASFAALPLIAGGLLTVTAASAWLLGRSRLPAAWLDAAAEPWPRRYRHGSEENVRRIEPVASARATTVQPRPQLR